MIERFPEVLDIMIEHTVEYMQVYREKTREIVEQILEAEENFLYTTNVDYLKNRETFLLVN